MKMRGVRYARTISPSFGRLNNVAQVFEMELMPYGTFHDKIVGVKGRLFKADFSR